MQLQVLNDQGAVLATRVGTGIGTFSFTVSVAGTYYLSIQGAGNGNPSSPPGFSSYGCRGQYEVAIKYLGGPPVSKCDVWWWCFLSHLD